jgi:hypothetical protein
MQINTSSNDLNSKQKLRKSDHLLNSNQELKQLWLACYFERRLSKPLIQSIDLRALLNVIKRLLSSDSVDFRVITPLVLGLTKIFFRKYNFLLSESNTTLE